MEKLKPKLFSVMKTYTKQQFVKDVIAGIIVAIIALPLSIALALASGVGPEQGIYTAIIAGFLISFLGGSRVQIAGPTAAFATIVAGIVAQKGMDGLILATILAGMILVVMGLLRLGNLIKYIPFTITTGFTAGIAVTIVIGQVKDFLGLTYPEGTVTIETMEKMEAIVKNMSTINWQALVVGLVCLAILIVWPYINKTIPGSLIAVIAGILMVKLLNMNVNTIGDLYEISNKLPGFHFPSFTLADVSGILPDAFTIAILAAIESLLSCVVADSMINSKHRSNMELIAQGIGNIGSALFGGIPATGAIARTAANIKNGGRTPIAGMVHAVTLVLILVVLMPYAALIPMPCIAAILFMKRMSDVTEVEGWKYVDEEEDPDSIALREVPAHTLVYEISGPMFFAAADKILNISVKDDTQFLILRMRSVSAIDATAMHSLEQLYEKYAKKNVRIILSHVNEQPRAVMDKAGFAREIGEDNFCTHIDEALERAKKLAAE